MLQPSDFSTIRVIGRGSTSVVELAQGPNGGLFALKRLAMRGSEAEIALATRRLAREAEVLERLVHPHITPLIGLYEDDHDIVLVMPYLADGSLADRVTKHGPLSVRAATVLCRELLDATAFAHRNGVVHRDISPRNVLFDGDTALLADFGIAINEDATVGLTQSGTVLGTPGTISPEQAKGEAASEPTDVFSIAATVLWALGTPIYGSGTATMITTKAARSEIAAVPVGLPAHLRRTLNAMLQISPTARPSASDALGMLEDATPTTLERPPAPLGATAAHETASGVPERDRDSKRRIAIGAVATVIVGTAIATGVWAIGRGGQDEASGSVTESNQPSAVVAPTTTCPTKKYQPCDQPAAPHTDGDSCIDDYDDYDDDLANGCEATPSGTEISVLSSQNPVSANLVPRDDVDSYELDIADNPHLLCDGHFEVSLRGAAGTRQRVTIVDPDGSEVGSAISDGSTSETVQVSERGCGEDDSGIYEVIVESVGSDRSTDNYVLTTVGSL